MENSPFAFLRLSCDLNNKHVSGIVTNKIRIGYKLETHRVRTVWFFRIAIVGVMLLRQPSAFAQTTSIAVSNGTASVSWPLTSILLLAAIHNEFVREQFVDQRCNSLNCVVLVCSRHSRDNVHRSSDITNIAGNNFVITQSMAGAEQFFRLKAPTVIPGFQFRHLL